MSSTKPGLAKLFFRYLLVFFFVGSGVMHFLVQAGMAQSESLGIDVPTDFYENIMPDYIPYKSFMVTLSGITEIIAGVMLAIPVMSRWGAWFIIAHLVAFFTVHFWMIQEKERYLSETVTIEALWLRVVLQVIFIVWAYWFTSTPKSAGKK